MEAVTGVGQDRAAAWGEQGLALIDRYLEGSDLADLDRAIEALDRAIEAGPDHPDCAEWHYRLALCHAERADSEPDAAAATMRYGRAVELGEVLYQWADPDDPDRDLAALLLADCHWQRSWRVRYSSDLDVADRAGDVDELLVALAALVPTGHHPMVTHYLRLLTGMAQLERYSYEPDQDVRVRLDAGVPMVAAELAWLTSTGDETADGPVTGWTCAGRLPLAYGLLADAYLTRGLLDESVADVDRAIEAARAAIAWDDADHPTQLLYTSLAEAHQARWYTYTDAAGDAELPPGATEQLDAAIDAWQVVLAEAHDTWAAWSCGDLLRERAERRGSRSDARAAVELLGRACADVADGGDRSAWKIWRARAQAEEVHARLTDDQRGLAAAVHSLDRALADPGIPEDDLLTMWASCVDWERRLADGGLVRPAAGAPGTATPYRAALDGARAALERASGAPLVLRGALAAMVALGEIHIIASDGGDYDARRVRRLLEFAADAGTGADNREVATLAEFGMAQLEHLEDLRHPSLDGDGGAARVARVLAAGALDPGTEHDARQLLAMLQASRRPFTGDRRRSVVDRTGASATGPADADDAAFAAYLDLMDALQDGDLARVRDAVHELGARVDAGAGSPPNPALARMFERFSPVTDPASASVPPLPPIRPVSGLLDGVAAAEWLTAAMSHLVHGVATDDRAVIERTAEYLDRLITAVPATETRMLASATGLAGHAWLHVARRHPQPRAAATRAAGHLQRALDTAGGHHMGLWANLAIACAEAVRLAGGPDSRRRSRELGRSAMRGYAWQVILQAGTEQAITAAADAGATARTVAGWCLDDRRYEAGVDDDLVAVLDAGRGLVLQAAATSRLVADRLVAHGHAELARDWRQTAGLGRDLITGDPLRATAGTGSAAVEIPDELRLKVLRVLAADEVVGFEPVTPGAIGGALRAIAADALVYLVPGDTDTPGAAVVVRAVGNLTVRTLPDLRAGIEGTAIARYARRHARTRDLEPLAPGDPDGALGEVCDWAWRAAMRDVLAELRGTRPGAPLRVVLIPMGVLGLVPWHAARAGDGAQPHHAVDEAVFSYAPSARLLCAGAAHQPTPIRSALVVGNPDGTLRFAGVEARSIHRGFYPDGSYFGQPAPEADGPGTPDDVLDWIARAAPGPSLLHFACHGTIDPARPTQAHLVLAGGAALSAGTLLERSRSMALEIEQVFLAACTTSVGGDLHDEVLSLATSFLAAGAHTVFGSLWSVPDEDTSVLMFMVHHFLRVTGCPPVDALHRAQLWMLDPTRTVPPGMPPELRRHCGSGRTFGLSSWAGFTHHGR